METYATWRKVTATWLLAVLGGVEITALGVNGPLLAIIAAVAEIVVAMLVLALIPPGDDFWKKAAPVLTLILAMLAWLILAHIVAPSSNRLAPDLLLPAVARFLGAVAVLLAAAAIGYRRGMMRTTLFAILLAGLATLILGIVFRQTSPDHIWGQGIGILKGRFTGTLLNANSAGCLAAMLAMLAFGYLLDNLRKGMTTTQSVAQKLNRIVLMLSIILCLAAVAGSGSRTVLATCITIIMVMGAADDLLWRLFKGWAGVVYIAIALSVVAILAFTVGELTWQRLAVIQTDTVGRVHIWTLLWQSAQASPWFGYGPLTFDQLAMRHMVDVPSARALWYIHAPHSILLSLLLAGGWPYLILTAVVGLAMLRPVVASRRNAPQDPVLRGLWAAIAVILVSAQVDIELDVPALVSLTIALVALAWGKALRAASDAGAMRADRPKR